MSDSIEERAEQLSKKPAADHAKEAYPELDGDLYWARRSNYAQGFEAGYIQGARDERERVEGLIEALEWYASGFNSMVSKKQYIINDGRTLKVEWEDIGERARKALEEFGGEG